MKKVRRPPARRVRWLRVLIMAVLGLFVLLSALAVGMQALIHFLMRSGRFDPVAVKQLDSEDPGERSAAAVRAAEVGDPIALERMISGLMGGEPDPAVRLAFISGVERIGAFGALESQRSTTGLEYSAELDPVGTVRAEAWAALARLDCGAFQNAIGGPAFGDPWRRLGAARGRLTCGDLSAAKELVALARSGDSQSAAAAWVALEHELRPLLERSGRWPEAQSAHGIPWSDELVSRILEVCAAPSRP